MRAARLLIAGTVLALAADAAVASERPGLDRPIRVGMFKGTGPNRYWHTNIHTSHALMREILARPDTAGLGDSLVIPPAGFTFHSMPVAPDHTDTAECMGSGCGPTQSQIAAFVSAMDTLDVIIMSSVTDWGSRVTDSMHRNAFRNFWRNKGYVAVHGMTDSYATWAPLDSIHGARLRGWPVQQLFTVRRDSVFMLDPAWRQLNRGVFSNGLDTSFFEEPIYFTESGETIRARSHLRPTVNLVESSVLNPGAHLPMGDHPYSWYRQLPEGGRFFYTALGHRWQVWQTTRMFRRQLYNAVLWAAGADSTGVVSVREPADKNLAEFSGVARLSFSGGVLSVSVLRDGAHALEIRNLDGRLVAARRGTGAASHRFEGLKAGMHVLAVETTTGRAATLVTVP